MALVVVAVDHDDTGAPQTIQRLGEPCHHLGVGVAVVEGVTTDGEIVRVPLQTQIHELIQRPESLRPRGIALLLLIPAHMTHAIG